MGRRCETPRALVDALVVARLEGDLLDQLADEVGDGERGFQPFAPSPRLLSRDLDAELQVGRVVRHHLGADAVFEGRDDLAAGGVVLGVGREDEHHVEREADGVALNLHVALLHDVEEADLNFAREVGQLVDGEQAAVGARQQAVVDGQLVAQQVAAARGLDRVNVADDVGDRHVGRRQFFDEALVAAHPVDGRRVALFFDQLATVGADGFERVVVDFGAGDGRHALVEELDELADDAALGLTAQTQQNQVVPREDGVDDLRDDRLVVADDAGENLFARAQFAEEVGAQLVLDRAHAVALPFEFAECFRKCHRW